MSESYLLLHQAGSNGLNRRAFIEMVLKNEHEEFLTYFPEYSIVCEDMARTIIQLEMEINTLWDNFKHLPSQKDFAQAIHFFPGKALLFEKRKDTTLDVRSFLLSNLSYAEKLLTES